MSREDQGPRTMRAAQLVEPRTHRIVEVPVPEPEPGEVLVRVEGTGLCGSNLPPWRGDLPWLDYPTEPGEGGHEAWGVVEALGSNVSEWRPRDRIAFLNDRALAGYTTVPEDHAVRIPPSLEDAPHVPAEPLACAVNAHQRSDISAGDTVVIVGCGFLGVLLAALSANAGARVVAVNRRDSGLHLAKRYGAKAGVRYEDRHQVTEDVLDIVGNEGADRVLECTGAQEPLHVATDLTRTRGRLVIVGYHQDGAREVNMQRWNWRGMDVVNAHERDPQRYLDGMKTALGAWASGELDPSPLLTHTDPLRDVDAAYGRLSKRPEGFMKSLVVMDHDA